jgi:NAD-dependent deacetylase
MRVFVLTGAGISAESGIPVFQGTSWRGRSHYQLASIDAWRAGPRIVWDYYSERRNRARDAQPNPAHFALAAFQQTLTPPAAMFLCTQNVDGLHEAAGSQDVVHIHGKLFESRCAGDCGKPAFADRNSYAGVEMPRCDCGALLRPNVCWFGEQPYELDRIYHELERCTVFLAIGTSGSVQPVAGFVALLRQRRDSPRTIYAGLDEPANASYFDRVNLGPASLKTAEVLAEISRNRQT